MVDSENSAADGRLYEQKNTYQRDDIGERGEEDRESAVELDALDTLWSFVDRQHSAAWVA